MIIEYDLQGSQMRHQGLFETTGFWAKFGEEKCDVTEEILTYIIWGQFSFTFEHTNKEIATMVWQALTKVLRDMPVQLSTVGYMIKIRD